LDVEKHKYLFRTSGFSLYFIHNISSKDILTKTDRHNITETLLKVALNTITLTH